jgi:hypothetical protein
VNRTGQFEADLKHQGECWYQSTVFSAPSLSYPNQAKPIEPRCVHVRFTNPIVAFVAGGVVVLIAGVAFAFIVNQHLRSVLLILIVASLLSVSAFAFACRVCTYPIEVPPKLL